MFDSNEVMATAPLARNPLFEGLDAEELEAIGTVMQPRTFRPSDVLCRSGEPGDSLLLITGGLARVVLGDDEPGESRAVARLRRGDVVGEMSFVTGEPRTATVVAAVQTTALELSQEDFAAVIARHPRVLANLNRILSRKLAETTARVGETGPRGEAVGLLVGSATAVVPEVLAATEAASPRTVASLDGRPSVETALAALDDALAENATVVIPAELGDERLTLLVDSLDRTVALVRNERDVELLAGSLGRGSAQDHRVEILVLAGAGEATTLRERAGAVAPVIRVTIDGESGSLPPDELAWLGRHLSRTKLGLALGAGGAKGYAHVGVLQVLEEAGYAVDCVAGSSIGAMVGAWIALGMGNAEIDATMRQAFTAENVAEMFKLSLSGTSTGLETHTRVLRETTQEKSFSDLVLPLAVMTVDLNGRAPAPVREGPLWQALLAATALAGIFPPYERDGQRLVDGLALVPVPVDSVVELGADVTVSVNIISRHTLPAWPGTAPPPEEARGPRSRMLDTLLEVMDVAQMDASERHAARADVPITPLFGPSSWRDFHLADLFLEAGRRAAEERLPALQALARPQLSRLPT